MNAPEPISLVTAPTLERLALATLARLLPADAGSAEAAWLAQLAQGTPAATFEDWAAGVPESDGALHALGLHLGLEAVELLAVALAVAVESDPMLGRVCAWLQAPVGGARPTLGLLHSMAEAVGLGGAMPVIAQGEAQRCGLLLVEPDSRTLPERTVQVPLPLALALRGVASRWPELRGLCEDVGCAPSSLRAAAERHAQTLEATATLEPVLALRSGHPHDAWLAAALLAQALGREAVLIESEAPRGLGPWLWLRGAVPVLCAELAPGESRMLPNLPGYRGPRLVATGLDGSFTERGGDPVPAWIVPAPLASERVVQWRELLEEDEAQQLGRAHRHSATHIERLSRAARREAQLDGAARATAAHVSRAARRGAAGELGTLAQLVTEEIADDALVVPPDLHRALLALKRRCELRETLAEGLGVATRTRYRSGVRALFVGPSGTGKTLAAGWLACRLGLPLYRVDLAAVSSKYIGETEKNLAQLFARAEHSAAMLMFDEADSLFGKRTEVKDSNDRFANAQTNYLLQRIESFDGIAILTSNTRARFDSAFTRRLDAILEFLPPGPEERRALWVAHLGAQHAFSPAELNRIAAICDLSGGHVRNIVLAAAAGARQAGDLIEASALRLAMAAEYRKLGKDAPISPIEARTG